MNFGTPLASRDSEGVDYASNVTTKLARGPLEQCAVPATEKLRMQNAVPEQIGVASFESTHLKRMVRRFRRFRNEHPRRRHWKYFLRR